MAPRPSPYTVFLQPFRGALCRALYLDLYNLSLDEFTDAMNVVFHAIQTLTRVQMQVSKKSWQSRKKIWDTEWDIKNGSPSYAIRLQYEQQPTWFYKSEEGHIVYKPFELDSYTLSMIPADFSMGTDIVARDYHHATELSRSINSDKKDCLGISRTGGSHQNEIPIQTGPLTTSPSFNPARSAECSNTMSADPAVPYGDHETRARHTDVPTFENIFDDETGGTCHEKQASNAGLALAHCGVKIRPGATPRYASGYAGIDYLHRPEQTSSWPDVLEGHEYSAQAAHGPTNFIGVDARRAPNTETYDTDWLLFDEE